MGHIIGGVLADTQEHSRRAARAVKVTYEDLTPIVTIEVRRRTNVTLLNSSPKLLNDLRMHLKAAVQGSGTVFKLVNSIILMPKFV